MTKDNKNIKEISILQKKKELITNWKFPEILKFQIIVSQHNTNHKKEKNLAEVRKK